MAAPETKQKILNASLQLFNQNGISNVRLQQIADGAGISVGNLAYHYSNKEAITESLVTNIIVSLRDLLRHYGKYATLKDIDNLFKAFYNLCTQYRFFNFDIFEIKRNFPALSELLQPLFSKVRLQLERGLELCLQQHLLKKEANIKNIVANLWLLLFFIPVEGQLNGKHLTSENAYRQRLWEYVSLHFTNKGITEYHSTVRDGFIRR